MPAHQNEIDLQFTAEQLAQLDAAIATLETLLAPLPLLSPDDKAGLVKPPDNADAWMVGMITRAEQNLGRLPRDFDPESIRRDLALDATLAPRELRLARVMDRLASGRYAARSDAFAAGLAIRRSLRDSGVTGVDDDLSSGLERFFRRSSAADKPKAPAPAPATA